MNQYDSMTVDELLFEYAEWARNHAGTHWEIHGTQGVVVDDENPLNVVARKHAIVAALRKACIREASVGRVAIKLCSSAANFDHLVVTHEEKPHEWNDYDLIPKETP